MRALTVPEQLVAATGLLLLVGLAHAAIAPAGGSRWLLVGFGLLGAGAGAWLFSAIRIMRQQHRLAADWRTRVERANEAAKRGESTAAEVAERLGVPTREEKTQ